MSKQSLLTQVLSTEHSLLLSQPIEIGGGVGTGGGRGAGGFVAYKDGSEWFSGSVSLGEWATVFQAEIHVISLVRGLYTRGLHESNINIFTDSQAALRAAQSGGEILDL